MAQPGRQEDMKAYWARGASYQNHNRDFSFCCFMSLYKKQEIKKDGAPHLPPVVETALLLFNVTQRPQMGQLPGGTHRQGQLLCVPRGQVRCCKAHDSSIC